MSTNIPIRLYGKGMYTIAVYHTMLIAAGILFLVKYLSMPLLAPGRLSAPDINDYYYIVSGLFSLLLIVGLWKFQAWAWRIALVKEIIVVVFIIASWIILGYRDLFVGEIIVSGLILLYFCWNKSFKELIFSKQTNYPIEKY